MTLLFWTLVGASIITPHDGSSTWTLHIAPQAEAESCQVRLFSNAFHIVSNDPAGTLTALVPEPGVMWGESDLPIAPSLF